MYTLVCVWRIGVITTLAKRRLFSSIGSAQASRCQGRLFDPLAGQFQHLQWAVSTRLHKNKIRPESD